ncbi:MAG: hypothetical protein PVH02_01690 [Desulfobacteraceae bacterium]
MNNWKVDCSGYKYRIFSRIIQDLPHFPLIRTKILSRKKITLIAHIFKLILKFELGGPIVTFAVTAKGLLPKPVAQLKNKKEENGDEE